MIEINCSGDRWIKKSQVLGNNDFVYKTDFTWAKWPEKLQGIHVTSACLDVDDIMYASTDNSEYPIVIFDKQGEYLRSIGQGLFNKAHSVFITPSKTLLIADSSNNYHVIREIDLEGKLIGDFGTFNVPCENGYDVDYYKVLMKEKQVPEDFEWDKKAKANARLDSIKKAGKPFCKPCSMVMNKEGEYFAADGYGNAAVHKFSKDGGYLFSWGEPGREPCQFRIVHDICIDSKDRIWVADRENSRVQVFSQTGDLIAIVNGNLLRVGSLWADQDYVYIGELDGGITIVDMNLEVASQFGYFGSPIHAHGLTGDSESNLFVLTNKTNMNNILRLVRL